MADEISSTSGAGQDPSAGGPPPVAPEFPSAPPPSLAVSGSSDVANFVVPPAVTLAPVGRRIGAYFLSILLFIVTLGIGWIIWGLILWPRGQSPAFKVLKLHVVPKEGGTPVGFWRMALRNIVGGFVQGILTWITMLISFVLFVVRPLHQPITDLIAGTTVAYDPTGVYDRMRNAEAA